MAFNYFESELRKVMTTHGNKVQVKFLGDVGETEWLSLTPEQFDRLEALMIDMGKE